jgi:anti-sigma-K factor RskA
MSAPVDMPDPAHEDRNVLAAEYVLGVLDDEAHRAAAGLAAADPAFAALVARWEADLAPIADDIAPHTAPAAVWPAIERHLRWREPARTGLWHSLAFWRGLGLSASALATAALVAVAVLSTRTPPAMPEPAMVAVLMQQDGRHLATAALDRAGRLTLVPAMQDEAANGQTHELWLIAADGVPRSLGTVSIAAPLTVMPASVVPAGEAVIAVSLEPSGGSPTGQPTGPVIASGPVREL